MSKNHPRHEEAYVHSCGCGGGSCAPQPSPSIPPQGAARPARHDHDHDHGEHAGHDHRHGEDRTDAAADTHAGHDHGVLPGWPRIAAALVLAVLAEAAHWGASLHPWLSYGGMALAVVAIGLSGLGVYKAGLKDLARFKLGIHALMAVAVTGAFLIGQWPEAAMVMALYVAAERIEDGAMERARHAIRSLLDLAPESAEVLQPDGSTVRQNAAQVPLGATLRIAPGARVPLDGTVTRGESAVNQAPITGESQLADKAPGDALYAGSVNQHGELLMQVTAPASGTLLARIVHAVEQAQASRAPTQRFVDRFAAVYTPIVFVLAVLLALAAPQFMGWSWQQAAYQALALLVIACPCALVISTPVTVVSGLAAAARHGILIKGGVFLEGGRKLKAVALDKTGTLTLGKPALTDVVPLGDMPIARVLLIAASLDDHSTHPVARALVNGWRERQPEASLLPVDDFRVLQGRGVRGVIEEQEWVLGNHRLVEELGVCSAALEKQLEALEQTGKTAVVLIAPAGPVAILAVADTLRPESAQAVAELKALHVEAVMLTGDNPATARVIADQLGIEDARGNLMPEDKQALIAELKERHGAVGMVGDGVNDAPALARADIGFAMGAAGTATALETADVAIMDDDPRKLARFIRLSRHTATVLKQNITLALGIKAVFLGLALSGHATLWMAVFADMGASLLVVFNGLRLLRK